VSYQVAHRKPVASQLFTIAPGTPIGVISDVDDTIMVTQAPSPLRAAYNLLLLNPKKRGSVPGMGVLFNKIADMFPQAPFFYLSTSPWNVESSIRNFIADQGFPQGPLLLRDLDPRPKTFIPSGVQHKLEFAEQLMGDFPDMRFILIGDDGQKDPTTYATIARRYPGRVLAIGIRQLSPREYSPLGPVAGLTTTQPVPVTDVPVFTGTTGSNLMKTMLPYLAKFQ
jgi:phosphatidate phosphatase APP1